MTRSAQLSQLAGLADLLLDSRLSALQAAARAKQDCEAQLAGLSLIPEPQPDLAGVAAQLAGLQYQRWAETRRAELNQQLARRTVALIEARDAAREAFGKKQVLAALADRHKPKSRRLDDP
jgi:hypothetical protein